MIPFGVYQNPTKRIMNHLIDEPSQLKELEPLFQQLSDTGATVSVDTEFLREKTYNAKLCLVQIGIGEHQYCIDVLAIDDLSLLVNLLADTKILKLFHAARQDMEVLYQTFGIMPKPIFDTQLAAAFCGADMQVGYGGMVLDELGVDLPKTQSRTDWTKRPLSAEQVEYAGDDVAYLESLYLKSRASLLEQGKLAWFEQEIESYYDPDLYVIDPELAYKRLSGGGFKLKQQYVLKDLATWRERSAQQKDIPRTWVLRDERLYELSSKLPSSVEQILDMKIFGRKSAKYLAPKAAKLISQVEVGEEVIWSKVEPLTRPQKALCSSLMKQIREIAENTKMAPALLATRKDVERIVRSRNVENSLKDWRRGLLNEVFKSALSN